MLSILDPGYPAPPAFGSFGEHERLELRFNDIIDEREDAIAPRREDIETLLRFGRTLLGQPPSNAHLLVHCHAGVSRSTAAMALILAQSRPDSPAADALAEVVRIRPQAWPNLRMIELGDMLLGRGGEIITAVRRHYRAVAFRQPELVPAMIAAGRGREVSDIASG